MSVILWIEDNPATTSTQMEEARTLGFKVEVRYMPAAIQQVLETKPVHGIVVDVMLYGVSNLESIRIAHSDTNGGKDAGWVLLEKLIWAKESPYRQIPTFILSARPYDDYQQSQLKGVCQRCEMDQLNVIYVEKGEREWQKKFSDWLTQLPSPQK